MASDSKMRHGAVNDSPTAINVARPVRVRRRSSGLSQKSFDANESGGESVRDALAHLLPAAKVHSSRPIAETVVIEDSDDEAAPSAYPVTPSTTPVAPPFSPLTPAHVNDEVGAGAEMGSARDKNTPECSPTRKSKKRKAGVDVPVTPPPRKLRLRSRQTTTTSKTTSEPKTAAAPKILKKCFYSSEGASAPQITNPLIALARHIENPSDFINALNESDALNLDSDERLSANATQSMSTLQRIRHNIYVKGQQWLRRQRALIHSYDTLDVQTYNPGDRVDPGTAALRHFVGILREGLAQMEALLAALLAAVDDLIAKV